MSRKIKGNNIQLTVKEIDGSFAFSIRRNDTLIIQSTYCFDDENYCEYFAYGYVSSIPGLFDGTSLMMLLLHHNTEGTEEYKLYRSCTYPDLWDGIVIDESDVPYCWIDLVTKREKVNFNLLPEQLPKSINITPSVLFLLIRRDREQGAVIPMSLYSDKEKALKAMEESNKARCGDVVNNYSYSIEPMALH